MPTPAGRRVSHLLLLHHGIYFTTWGDDTFSAPSVAQTLSKSVILYITCARQPEHTLSRDYGQTYLGRLQRGKA